MAEGKDYLSLRRLNQYTEELRNEVNGKFNGLLTVVEMGTEEYEDLSEEEKNKNVIYIVSDKILFVYDAGNDELIIGLTEDGQKEEEIFVSAEYGVLSTGALAVNSDSGAKLNKQCSYKKLTIDGDILSSNSAFCSQNVSSLEELILDGVVMIPYKAFGNCTGLKTIAFPSSGLKLIDTYSFENTGMTELTFPDDSELKIGYSAFQNCSNLETININNNVVTSYCFQNCPSIKTVNINGIKPASQSENYIINKGHTDGMTVNMTGVLNFWGYYSGGIINCDSGFDLYVNNAVIGEHSGSTFSRSNVKTIDIQNSTVIVGREDFASCPKLTTAVIGNNLTEVRYAAFQYSSLTSLELINTESSLMTLNDFAMTYCRSLKSVKITAENLKMGVGVFDYCSELESVDFSEVGLMELTAMSSHDYTPIFAECPKLKIINFPNLKELSTNTFIYSSNANYEEITFKDVGVIYGNSFVNQYKLHTIRFTGHIEHFGLNSNPGSGVFMHISLMPALATIIFTEDSSVNTFHAYAFNQCCVKEIIVPENTETVEEKAFFLDKGLVYGVTQTDEDRARVTEINRITDADEKGRAMQDLMNEMYSRYVVKLPMKFKNQGDDFDYSEYYGRNVEFYE